MAFYRNAGGPHRDPRVVKRRAGLSRPASRADEIPPRRIPGSTAITLALTGRARVRRRCGLRAISGRSPDRCAALPALRPEHVPREEHREVDDHADHGRGDAVSGAVNRSWPCVDLDERAAGEDEQERRQEREERRDARAGDARPANSDSRPKIACVQPPTKPTNATTMISGPGVRLAEREAVDHLRRREPAVVSRPRPDTT